MSLSSYEIKKILKEAEMETAEENLDKLAELQPTANMNGDSTGDVTVKSTDGVASASQVDNTIAKAPDVTVPENTDATPETVKADQEAVKPAAETDIAVAPQPGTTMPQDKEPVEESLSKEEKANIDILEANLLEFEKLLKELNEEDEKAAEEEKEDIKDDKEIQDKIDTAKEAVKDVKDEVKDHLETNHTDKADTPEEKEDKKQDEELEKATEDLGDSLEKTDKASEEHIEDHGEADGKTEDTAKLEPEEHTPEKPAETEVKVEEEPKAEPEKVEAPKAATAEPAPMTLTKKDTCKNIACDTDVTPESGTVIKKDAVKDTRLDASDIVTESTVTDTDEKVTAEKQASLASGTDDIRPILHISDVIKSIQAGKDVTPEVGDQPTLAANKTSPDESIHEELESADDADDTGYDYQNAPAATDNTGALPSTPTADEHVGEGAPAEEKPAAPAGEAVLTKDETSQTVSAEQDVHDPSVEGTPDTNSVPLTIDKMEMGKEEPQAGMVCPKSGHMAGAPEELGKEDVEVPVEEKKEDEKPIESMKDAVHQAVEGEIDEKKKEDLKENLAIYIAGESNDRGYLEYNRLLSEAAAIRSMLVKKYSKIAEGRVSDLMESADMTRIKIQKKAGLFDKLHEDIDVIKAKDNATKLSLDETAFKKF